MADPKKQSFEEFRKSLRDAGGSAWDGLDVDQELAAMRGQPQGTEARVCDDITERQALGINKYGKTVEHNPLSLREWLEHAYQECLDQAIYLKRAIEQIDRNGANALPLDKKCKKCGSTKDGCDYRGLCDYCD